MVTAAEIVPIAYYCGFVSVIFFLPLVCLLDSHYREVPNIIWEILIAVNIPALVILYTNGLPYSYLVLSVGLVGLYCLLWGIKSIGGADAKFLSVIAIVTPITPFSYTPFQLIFYFWLIMVFCSLPVVIYAYNRWIAYDTLHPDYGTMKYMFTHYPGGIPYMIPISLAFLLAIAVSGVA